MRLKPAHVGWRIRLDSFPNGQYYDIKMVGRFQVIAIDERGKEVIFNRDDSETHWVYVSRTPSDQLRLWDNAS